MLTTHLLRRIAASIAVVGFATFLGGAPAISQDVIKVGAPLPLTLTTPRTRRAPCSRPSA